MGVGRELREAGGGGYAMRFQLTELQREALVAAEPPDYCVRADGRTMASLVHRGWAMYTSGFGWQYGAVIELTAEGKEQRAYYA